MMTLYDTVVEVMEGRRIPDSNGFLRPVPSAIHSGSRIPTRAEVCGNCGYVDCICTELAGNG